MSNVAAATDDYSRPLLPHEMTLEDIERDRARRRTLGVGARDRIVNRCPPEPRYYERLAYDPRPENPLCLKYRQGDRVHCGYDIITGTNAYVVQPADDVRPILGVTLCYLIGLGPPTPETPTCKPETEVCDTFDNDCDGDIDEGGVCSTDPGDQPAVLTIVMNDVPDGVTIVGDSLGERTSCVVTNGRCILSVPNRTTRQGGVCIWRADIGDRKSCEAIMWQNVVVK